MKKRDLLRKAIYLDCRTAMTPAVVFYALEEVGTVLLAVYTASILGAFADNIFSLDLSYGLDNFWKLLLCVGITVVIIPLFEIAGEVLMFSNSLKHDRFVLGRFFDKSFESVMQISEGEAQSRLEDDPIDLRCGWVRIAVKSIVTPPALLYLLYYTLQISVIYTLIVFGISVIKLAVPATVAKLQAVYDRQTREYRTQVRTYETEITTKPYMIKLYAVSQPFTKKLDSLYQDYFQNVFSKSVRCSVVADNISDFLDTFCYLLILLVGAVMIAGGSITAGAVAAMVGYFSVFNTIMENIDFIIKNIPIMKNLVDRLEVIYSRAEDLSGEQVDEVWEIKAEKLSFSYDGENMVFENMDFSIRSGDKTAVCGKNGSGKSTFIQLLCGLLKNYTGSFTLNNSELRTIAIESWRSRFAYAAQDPYLFEGTVRENVHLGNLQAAEADVDDILQKIGIGYLADRKVSMSQNDLSGGEKQKVSIARALMKNTPFLILDEPSNHLDTKTSEWLREFISESSKTILYISYDARFVDLADKQIQFL